MAVRTVAVLFGGVSTEHLVSGRSAYNLLQALREAGFETVRIGITKGGRWVRYEGPDETIRDCTWEKGLVEYGYPALLHAGPLGMLPGDFLRAVAGCDVDVVFPAVHGINCEDGTLQGFLELTGIPYVGSGVLASAACMDKLYAKRLFREARLPQVPYTSATRAEIRRDAARTAKRVAEKVGLPCFLKPANGGSSVGTCKAADLPALEAALRDVAAYDRTVVVEAFVACREIECAVLGNDRPKAAVLGEVVTAAGVDYYDYEAKYFKAGDAQVLVPAPLPEDVAVRIRRLAVRAYKALGCAGLSRVDFFLDPRTGKVYLNEINTMPGFTAISVFPKAWAASGLPVDRLAARLVRLAVEEKKAKARKELL
jgi:D-alanine-D-alanine ligase